LCICIPTYSPKKFIKRFASKAAEHILRLAGIPALIDEPDTNQIDVQHIERGIKLVDYYLSEILRIQVNPELALAQKIFEHFWDKGREVVTLEDVYQSIKKVLQRFDKQKKAREIMRILEEHGWVKPCPKGMEIDGKKYNEAWGEKWKNFE
jgi:hypothetical protein